MPAPKLDTGYVFSDPCNYAEKKKNYSRTFNLPNTPTTAVEPARFTPNTKVTPRSFIWKYLREKISQSEQSGSKGHFIHTRTHRFPVQKFTP